MKKDDTINSENPADNANAVGRRDFLYVASASFAAVGAAFAAWPFIDQMNPDSSVKALSSIEVDLESIKLGQLVTVEWRGKPVFIRRRTKSEIEQAEEVPLDDLIDPQSDEDRVKKKQWLIVEANCTHLGCVPLGNKGDYGGWLCPCHGSQFDISGRVRKGPAPTNLPVPEYEFIGDNMVRIGKEV